MVTKSAGTNRQLTSCLNGKITVGHRSAIIANHYFPLSKALCQKIMNRIFYVLLIPILLSGCPATFNGFIKNESDKDIVVILPFETELNWPIDSGAEGKISWYQECITIKLASKTQYFSGWPIPDNVVKNGLFSSSLKAVYKDGNLFFVGSNEQLIKVKEVAVCGKA